jgi:hypothetical protein
VDWRARGGKRIESCPRVIIEEVLARAQTLLH